MNINWRTLSIALIISIIVTELSSILFALTGIIQVYPMYFDYLLQFSSENFPKYYDKYYDMNISIILADRSIDPPFFLSLWFYRVVFLLFLITLTILFYFFIDYLKKKYH